MKKPKSKLILYPSESLWNEFKKAVPRDQTLHDGVIDAIKEYIKKRKSKLKIVKQGFFGGGHG